VGPGGGRTVFLVGTYELTIDAKNRLSIPFAIRRKLDERRDGHSFYVLPGQRQGTLALYPEVYFEGLRPVPPAESLSEDTHRWRQFEFSQCALLDPDGQGRVLIPERLLKRAGLGKEVTLIGVQDHLELWDRRTHEEFENGQWAQYAENRAKAMQELRALAMARPATPAVS
jgi:MraZ protein